MPTLKTRELQNELGQYLVNRCLEAMGCGNVIVAHDNAFNREVLGDSGLFFSTSTDVGAAIDSVDGGEVNTTSMKRRVVERVKQFYTWDRITDHYCELGALARSESRGRARSFVRLSFPTKAPGISREYEITPQISFRLKRSP